MKIRELVVPSVVELGSENILLDCDFDYDEDEKVQLDIKWYFNREPTPFSQWVPAQMARPQIIGQKFRNHVDLDHVVHEDNYKSHRALLLKRPTLELSGTYTCKVSTFITEDIARKEMIVFCKCPYLSVLGDMWVFGSSNYFTENMLVYSLENRHKIRKVLIEPPYKGMMKIENIEVPLSVAALALSKPIPFHCQIEIEIHFYMEALNNLTL